MDCYVYARISQTDSATESLGVQRQREDCLAEASRRGWQVREVLVDDDQSAFEGRFRPEYERLVGLIENGQCKALIAWRGDRLHRDLEQYLSFQKLATQHKVAVAFVQSGDWRLETADGWLSSTMLAMLSDYESRVKRERVLRAFQQKAERGEPQNTRFRAFGFEPDGITVRESEAALVRKGAEDYLAGRTSLAALGRLWERSTTGVRDIFLNPRTAGLRVFQGKEYPASWTAILDSTTYHALKAQLLSQSTPGRPPKNLLPGIAVCGYCDSLLKVGTISGSSYYRCRNRACTSKVSRSVRRLEEYVTAVVLNECTMTSRAPMQSQEGMRDALSEIERLQSRIAEHDAQLANPSGVPVAVLLMARSKCEEQIAEIQKATEWVRVEGPEGAPWQKALGAWQAWWEGASLTDRRSLIRSVLREVRVYRTAGGGRRQPFEEETVELVPHATKADLEAQAEATGQPVYVPLSVRKS